MDWVVTIPRLTSWDEYEKEIAVVADRSSEMMYRVPYRPKAVKGDRCFVVWRGKVRGWMEVVDVLDLRDGFTCTTTGRFWKPGFYIARSGPFHAFDGPEMKGFQGIRRFVCDM